MNTRVILSLLAFTIGGIAFADSGATVAQGPMNGISPTTVNIKGLSHSTGSSNGLGHETPLGYEIANGKFEDLKAGTGPVDLSGTFNGTGGTLAAGVGTNFTGPQQNGWVPYDAAIAVGPDHVIALTNSQFGIWSKTGTFVSMTQYTALPYGDGFDAKCFYDANANAVGDGLPHFVVLIDQQTSSTAHMVVGVSQTTDPTGAWWWYQYDWTLDGTTVTSNWGDYPSLGYDDNAIYIGANQYSFSNSYKYSKVRVLSKAQLYTGSTSTYTDFVGMKNADGTSAFTVKASRNLSSSASEYLLNTRPGGGSSVTLWRIDNPVTSPTITRVATVSVGSYAVPPNGRQPGGSSIATNDCRTQDVVVQNGVLYTGFTEKYGTRKTNQGAGLRYLVITTAGVKQKDISYYTSGIDLCYPAVTVDNSGNMFMTFSRSSKTEYVSAYYAAMKTTETSIEQMGLLQSGTGTITFNRWGDYSGVANDPSRADAVWMFSGYSNGAAWGTYIAATSFTTPLPKLASATQAASIELNESYPNPFATSTTITFALPAAGQARVAVVDALGRTVQVLTDGDQSAGAHTLEFSAANLPTGVYYCRLDTDAGTITRRMLVTR